MCTPWEHFILRILWTISAKIKTDLIAQAQPFGGYNTYDQGPSTLFVWWLSPVLLPSFGHSDGLLATPVSYFLTREEFSAIMSDFMGRYYDVVDRSGHSHAPSTSPLKSLWLCSGASHSAGGGSISQRRPLAFWGIWSRWYTCYRHFS